VATGWTRLWQIIGVWACLLVAPVAAAGSANWGGSGLAPRSPAFMLYISRSLGGAAPAKPTFGLRLEQVRLVQNSGGPDSGDALQHRPLLDWKMEAHSDLRVALGGRLTWDFTNRRFGNGVTRSAFELPAGRSAGVALSEQRLMGSRIMEPPGPRPAQDPNALRDIITAAVATFAPSRLLPLHGETSARRPPQSRQIYSP
jgi:hypothetical protein